MKAAQIEIGGFYVATVDGKPEVVRLGSTGKTDWHKYPRTAYSCRIISSGGFVQFTDARRLERVATPEEIETAKGEK